MPLPSFFGPAAFPRLPLIPVPPVLLEGPILERNAILYLLLEGEILVLSEGVSVLIVLGFAALNTVALAPRELKSDLPDRVHESVFGLSLVEEYATVEKRPAVCVEGH